MTIALVLTPLAPASAASACTEVKPPAVLDGGTATAVQLDAYKKDVIDFLKRSDAYQACLMAEANADPTLKPDVSAEIQANQDLKVKTGAAFNAAILAYRLHNNQPLSNVQE